MNRNGSDKSEVDRPEELIVDIYRQRDELARSGVTPASVVISIAHYREIQTYHARLGAIAEGKSDYIDRYRLFDLEICIEDIEWPRVQGPAVQGPGVEGSRT